MEEIQLEVTLRKEVGRSKARALRRANMIPAVVYGEKLNFPVNVNKSQFQKAIGSRSAENVIMNLKLIDEASKIKKPKEHSVIIKDIQYDPVFGSILHVDFNEISLTKELVVKVPLVAKGDPVGVKQDGGVLQHQVWELEIKCLPKNLPKNLEADVTNLKIGDSIHLRDLKLPEGVTALQDQDMVVLSVVPPTKVEAAPVAEEVAVASEEVKEEPEVIKEKKKEEEEAAPEAKEKAKEKTKE
ncbi:MAG: 50S ribosomal protein L25 [Candidatus Omnitrophota bacterium]